VSDIGSSCGVVVSAGLVESRVESTHEKERDSGEAVFLARGHFVETGDRPPLLPRPSNSRRTSRTIAIRELSARHPSRIIVVLCAVCRRRSLRSIASELRCYYLRSTISKNYCRHPGYTDTQCPNGQ